MSYHNGYYVQCKISVHVQKWIISKASSRSLPYVGRQWQDDATLSLAQLQQGLQIQDPKPLVHPSPLLQQSSCLLQTCFLSFHF